MGGGFGAEGVAAEVRGVEVPLEDLRAPELGGDLRGKDAFTQGAPEGRAVVEEQEFETSRCARVGCSSGLVRPASGSRSDSRIRVGGGDDRVPEGFGEVLRIVVAEGDVAARQSRVGDGGEGEDDVPARAVGDTRGLEQQPLGGLSRDGRISTEGRSRVRSTYAKALTMISAAVSRDRTSRAEEGVTLAESLVRFLASRRSRRARRMGMVEGMGLFYITKAGLTAQKGIVEIAQSTRRF